MAVEYPRKLGNLGHIGLHPEITTLGIEAEREKIERGVNCIVSQFVAVGHAGHRVIVDDKAEKLVLVLKFYHTLHHGKVITDMQGSRRLYAG